MMGELSPLKTGHMRQLTDPFDDALDTTELSDAPAGADPMWLLEELPPISKVLREAMLGTSAVLVALDEFPELTIPEAERQALISHVRAAAASLRAATDAAGRQTEPQNEEEEGDSAISGLTALKVDWIVDIADTTNDWFFGVAVTYNDVANTVHVAVPDAASPVWEGDVELHSHSLRMVECHDRLTDALFKEIIRSSAFSVDWRLRLPALLPRTPTSPRGAAAAVRAAAAGSSGGGGSPKGSASAEGVLVRARYFLPMGCYALVQLEGGDCGGGSGNGGGSSAEAAEAAAGMRLIDVDANVTLLACECDGRGADAFYQLAEDGVVEYDSATVDWRAHKTATLTAAAFAAAAASHGGQRSGGRGSSVGTASRRDRDSLGSIGGSYAMKPSGNGRAEGRSTADVCREMRLVLESTREARQVTVDDEVEVLKRLRRFVLEGDLLEGEWLLDHVTELDARDAANESAARRDAALDEVAALEEAMVIVLESCIAGNRSGAPSLEDLQREKEALAAELEELRRKTGASPAAEATARSSGGSGRSSPRFADKNRRTSRQSNDSGGGDGRSGGSGLLFRRRASSKAAGSSGHDGSGRAEEPSALSLSPPSSGISESRPEDSPLGSAASVAGSGSGNDSGGGGGSGSRQRKGSVFGALFARKSRGSEAAV